MDHKHFQSAKRPFSVIFNSKPTNQVIWYKHDGQVSAKILLEQKADRRMKNHICPHIRTGCCECKCRECNTFPVVRINVQMFEAMPFKR